MIILINHGRSKPLRKEIQAAADARKRQLRYPLIYSGKVYKVRLNDGKEGKDASYFVAKKMFL